MTLYSSAGTGGIGGDGRVGELEFCGSAGLAFSWLVFGAEAGARLFFFWAEVDAGAGTGFVLFLGWLGGVLGAGVGLRLIPVAEAICTHNVRCKGRGGARRVSETPW